MTDLRHRLAIIRKSLRVNNLARELVEEQVRSDLCLLGCRRRNRIGVGITHPVDLGLELDIAEQDSLAYPVRNHRG